MNPELQKWSYFVTNR